MTGIGKDDSFDYQVYFQAYSESELKDMLSKGVDKTEFSEAAMLALGKIVDDFKRTHSEKDKTDFVNLASKFVQLFPEDKENIDQINVIAYILGIKKPIQETVSEAHLANIYKDFDELEALANEILGSVSVKVPQTLEECKEFIRKANSEADIQKVVANGANEKMLIAAAAEIAMEYLKDSSLDKTTLENKLEFLIENLGNLSGVNSPGDFNKLVETMISNRAIFAGTKRAQVWELSNLKAWLEFSKEMPFAAFLHESVNSGFKPHFEDLLKTFSHQLAKVPIIEGEVIVTYQQLLSVAYAGKLTIPENIQDEVSNKLTRSLYLQNGSPDLKLALGGKLSEMSLEQIRKIPVELENLFKKFPAPPEVRRTALSEAVYNYVNTHRDEITINPEIATRAHDILHDLAQREMAEGKYQSAFAIESKAATLFPLPASHPLHEMDKAILAGTAKQVNPKTGANFGSMDTSIVKGGHLHAAQRTIDGKLLNCFDFKVSHYARDELTVHLQAILDYPDEFKASLPPGLCTDVKINRDVPQQFVRFDAGNNEFTRTDGYCPWDSLATEIIFEGAGKIIIGNTSDNGTMYNWIQVEMDANLPAGEGAQKLQQMLAVAGLGPVLGKQPAEADERMKILQLFRAFYPSSCTIMDTHKRILRLSIEELKRDILALEPDMEGIFKKYLETNPELMEKVTIMPGKEVWGVKDLGQLMKARGAWGLMTGIGNSGGWDSAKAAVVRILTQGAMSSEQRFQTGEFKHGQSSEDDLMAGGGDQVFTRMVTQRTSIWEIEEWTFYGNAQILWNLDTLAPRVPYGYDADMYGIKSRFFTEPDDDGRSYADYQSRLSPVVLASAISQPENEMMFKNAIDPSHVMGVLVQSNSSKVDLIRHLTSKGLAEEDGRGDVYIVFAGKRIKADDFIHVGDKFKKEWWG